MREAIELMIRLREIQSLDQKVALFTSFLRDEFQYDGFVYGIALDTSSVDSFLDSFHMKRVGRSNEWHQQYATEDLGKKDLSVLHALQREGVLQQSRVFEKVDQNEIPPFYREVPNRVRDYSKSGFFLSLRARGLPVGMGLHSSVLEPRQHDEQFEDHGEVIVELCRQFHDMACWKQDIVEILGLSETNLQILELRSQGLLAKQIIEITGHEHENSVAQHMQQVRQKLRTKNEKQTMMRAAGLGLTGQMGFLEVSLKHLEENAKNLAKREGWLGEIV